MLDKNDITDGCWKKRGENNKIRRGERYWIRYRGNKRQIKESLQVTEGQT